MKRFFVCLAVLALLASGRRPAQAESVLLLSTGNATNDNAVVTLLQAQGDTVKVGPTDSNFTGGSLSGYNAVLVLQGGSNVGVNIPLSGQTALVDYVNSGGGLLTSEWTVWGIGAQGYNQTLQAVIPVIPTSVYNYVSPITYSENTPNAVLNSGLPSSFTFAADNVGGTQTYFQPQTGATVFYGSDFGNNGAGVIGWDYGSGRVLSLSTLAGPTELADPNYARLFSNAVNWVSGQGSSVVPEPSALTLLGIGVAGLTSHCWRRRRRAAIVKS